MRVMMVLKSDAPTEAGVLPSQQLLTDMGHYNQRLVDAGVMIGGEGLHPSSKATKVRFAKGKLAVIDGPFAEAKEVVAGYFLLNAKSLADAIDWAKQLPVGDLVADVELRPLYETEDFALDPSEEPDGWRDTELAMRDAPKASGPEKGRRWISFIMADKNTEAGMEPNPELLRDMGALIQEMAEKGVLISGDGLKPSREGARVHIANEKVRVVDGPFTEAKELIAGFTLYRAHTKAEAVDWARRTLQIHVNGTGIDHGEIQVFPVFETEEIPVAPEEVPGGWRDQEKLMRERLGQ